MTITTEALVRSSAGFGITTASPAQVAACRIIDGRPLGADLLADPDVAALVGGPEALAALPSERGVLPSELLFLAAIRCAKTIISVAAALRMALTADTSKLGPGEVARVSLLSLKLDLAAVAFRLALETVRASKVLAPLLLDATADTLTLRNRTGRPVELAAIAGARAGAGLVSRWSGGVVFDEAPRMSGADDAIVNLEHARDAVLGRLLPGAQVLYIGSPWAPFGPCYEWCQEHWAKPSDAFVVLRGTGPMLHPQYWTPERCAKLQSANATAYATDVLGEFADPESGLLSPVAVRAAVRDAPLELPPDRRGGYVAAVDPSEGAARGNGFTLLLVQRVAGERGPDGAQLAPSFRVVVAREFRGARPDDCWREIAHVCHAYGLQSAVTDQYAAAANADLAKRHGLRLTIDKTTAASKLEDFTNLATLIHSGRIELAPVAQLTADLLSIRKRTTQSGTAIVLPRTGDGRHADYAPALVAAIKHAGVTAVLSYDDMKTANGRRFRPYRSDRSNLSTLVGVGGRAADQFRAAQDFESWLLPPRD